MPLMPQSLQTVTFAVRDDSAAKTASATKKTNLRDATDASAISSATDIAGLKAAWDEDLLGDSPYA